jgi:hypothetical protein
MDPRIQIRIHNKMSWIRNTASSNSNINSNSSSSSSQQRIVLKSASTDVFTNLGKALPSLNTSHLPLVLPAKLNGVKVNL